MDNESIKQILIMLFVFYVFTWLLLPFTLQAIERNTGKAANELEKIRKLLEYIKNVRNP